MLFELNFEISGVSTHLHVTKKTGIYANVLELLNISKKIVWYNVNNLQVYRVALSSAEALNYALTWKTQAILIVLLVAIR